MYLKALGTFNHGGIVAKKAGEHWKEDNEEVAKRLIKIGAAEEVKPSHKKIKVKKDDNIKPVDQSADEL